MSANNDLRERWKDVIKWSSFWDELDELLNRAFEEGRNATVEVALADIKEAQSLAVGEESGMGIGILYIVETRKTGTDKWEIYKESGRGLIAVDNPETLKAWQGEKHQYRAVPYVRAEAVSEEPRG